MSVRPIASVPRPVTLHWLVGPLLLAGLAWSYWPTLLDLWRFWQSNADYSVGQLVPLVALYLVWSNRKSLRETPVRFCWWGLLALASAQAVRFAGLYYDYASLERYSLVFTIWSLCWVVLGWPFVQRQRWVLVFLLLAVPLPGRLHNAVTLPLQNFATRSAAFSLELLGFWVQRDGNVLQVNEQTQVAVAEACNGLRMLTAFIFVSATLAIVVSRPGWQKVVVVASSIPVAIAANTLRLIVTVILAHVFNSEVADTFFHDFAGVTMMPVAILILLGELAFLRWLASPSQHERPACVRQGPPTRHSAADVRRKDDKLIASTASTE